MSSTLLAGALALNGSLAFSGLGLLPAPQNISYCPDASVQNEFNSPQRLDLQGDIPQDIIVKIKTERPEFFETKNAAANHLAKVPLIFKQNPQFKSEAYQISLLNKQIQLEAGTSVGFYRGWTTIQQLIDHNQKLPCAIVQDAPRMEHRGLHLDVSRHFFEVAEIKKIMNAMAMHKLNVFHWHLTDTQGWRIQIKAYPKLTEIGAYRADRQGVQWQKRTEQQINEKATYGGFYTQEQIREVVAYAKSKHISIIPEIEIPAHASAAIVAYPWLACNDPVKTVPTGGVWPETQLMCPAKDSVVTFLKTVLGEVADLFPGEYIHLGGDEADYEMWKKSPLIQAKMKEKGFKTEHELQGWLHSELSNFLATKGKKTLGWDEILEQGPMPSNAGTMIWRNEEAFTQSIERKMPTIYAYSDRLYFDYAQAQGEGEPESIGGHTPLEKVYSLEIPTIAPENQKYFLGIQAQMWTEYVPDTATLEYKLFPRVSALAERAWSPESQKDYPDFLRRLALVEDDLRKQNFNFKSQGFKPEAQFKTGQIGQILVNLKSPLPELPIQYSVNPIKSKKRSLFKTYNDSTPLSITTPSIIEARLIRNGQPFGRPLSLKVNTHATVGLPIQFSSPASSKFNGNNKLALSDGLFGTINFSDGYWTGWEGEDLELQFAYPKAQPFESLSLNFLQDNSSWIFAPKKVQIWVSEDQKGWSELAEYKRNEKDILKKVVPTQWKLDKNTPLQYFKIKIEAQKICPEGHSGSGQKCWLFLDEVELR